MRLETDEAFNPDRTAGAPHLSMRSAVGNRILHFLRHNKLLHLPGKSRAASGGDTDHTAGRSGTTRVATSSVECAVSGSRLRAIRKLDKSRWQISNTQSGAIIEYQMFVDSPGPFGAQFNSHHAFFNLAQLLMYPVDARNQAMVVC